MKKHIALVLTLAAIATGCSYSRLTHGDACATNIRLFWTTEGFKFTAQTNGAVTIELQHANADTETLKAIAEGVAAGAVKGAK